jgi:hypothetical protein
MERLSESSNFREALELAKKKYRVIPILPGSKAPAIKWKPYQDRDPTEEELWSWFDGTDYGVAFVCGNGLVIVDCDDDNEVDFVTETCGQTPTMTRTPRGGFHLPYRMRKGVRYGNAVNIRGKSIDLRCEGGYAIEPWTKGYTRIGELPPLDELPIIRIGALRERKRRPRVELEDISDGVIGKARSVITGGSRYAEAALRYESQNVATAQEGVRNDTLNRAAFSLGGLVAVGLLSRETVESALFRAALAAGLGEAEIAATINSGITAGMQRPRK